MLWQDYPQSGQGAVKKRGVFVVPIVFTALRIPSGEGEFAGFLAQALLVGGIVFLLLLLVGVVFWRARRTKRDRSK
jgi:hypothetical protein